MRKLLIEKWIGARWLGVALPILLAACANQALVLDQPDRVWPSSRGMDNAAACVIRVLDDRTRSQSTISPTRTYAKHVIDPGKVYEIRADQDRLVTSETYVVRLEKVDDHITRMSAFINSPWKKQVIRALASCGT
jgi:hypothetical protein